MQKVVAVNLNGRAYHVEEPGYTTRSSPISIAPGTRLAENPDRAEILADLEQAIAEKCDRLLGPNKTVVAGGEIDRILTEMGPVDAGDADATAAAGGGTAAAGEKPGDGKGATRRLYQIREGSMISGLCAGLAAYFQRRRHFRPRRLRGAGRPDPGRLAARLRRADVRHSLRRDLRGARPRRAMAAPSRRRS